MRPALIVRLALDLLAASLLVLAFAYHWLGNVAHEIMGTALFVLLLSHNVFNRRWYGTIGKRPRQARGLVSRAITLSLLATMLIVLATSVIISQSIFSLLLLASTVTTRQLHTLIGYLALLLVSAHIGMSWTLIMAMVCARLGIASDSKLRGWFLRTIVLANAVYGVHSLFVLNIGAKLSMQAPMDFGAFLAPTPATLVHHIAIVGLGASMAHYSMRATHD